MPSKKSSPMKILFFFVALPALFLSLNSCSQPNRLDILKYKNDILEKRAAKDRYFKVSPQSPLIQEHQWAFTALAYFPPDIKYKVQAEFIQLAAPLEFRIQTSSGHERVYTTTGQINFVLAGKKMRLMAYQDKAMLDQGSADSLFVPFSDLTTGRESYGAGRYLDIEMPEGNLLTLDFNLAYNPYCAYNKNYSCPIPPQENHLDVAIEAGEKKFPLNIY